jgi:cation-transporting P-type ATPase I
MADLRTLAGRIASATGAITDLGPNRGRRRVWSRAGRAHVEVRGLTGRGPEHRRLAQDVTGALARLKGVRWAEVNAVTAHVFIAFDEDDVDIDELVAAVEVVEEAHGTHEDSFSWSHPPHPTDDTALASAAVALAADVLGIVSAATGRLARLGAPPRGLRAPIAIIETQPRLRGALGTRLGPVGADLVLAVANAAAHGLTEGAGPLAVDAISRVLQLGELRSRRDVWERMEVALHSTGHALPAETAERKPRPLPLPQGPIEAVADRISAASFLGASGILAWTRDPAQAADALLATVPRAARLGREGFATAAGSELARRDVLPLDNTVLRRLDRVTAVIIDAAVLCSPQRRILSAESTSRGLSAAEIWQYADRVLAGRSPEAPVAAAGPVAPAASVAAAAPAGPVGPAKPAGKLAPARGGWRLRRVRGTGDGSGPGPGASSMDLVDSGGRSRGRVRVGLELDPLADALLRAARDAADLVLLTQHDSVTELAASADEIVSTAVPLADQVRKLQAQGHGVLAVSVSADEALEAADVGVGVLAGAHAVPWSADLICGPGLLGAWRVLRAVPAARQASDRAARLALGGSALGGLLVAVGTGSVRSRGGLTPVHSAALVALLSGAATAWAATRQPDPEPLPHGAWHAMSAEDAASRLWEAREAPSVERASTAASSRSAGSGAALRPPAGMRVLSAIASRSVRGGFELTVLVRDELRDPLTPVLAFGAVASAVVGSTVDAALVASVMTGNALISGAERMRAERALRRLLLEEQVVARRPRWRPPRAAASIAEPQARDTARGARATSAAGLFAGLAQAPLDTVPARELSAGDVIMLCPSDVVPADARLLLAADLEIDESTLTGESVPVTKTPAPTPGAPLAERTCMIYEGSSVLAGTGYAVVTATGRGTEAGRAASTASRAAPPAGIQARLAELTRIALPATGLGGLAVAGLGLVRGVPLRQAVASGIAVAVAAVPEGLPLVATVSELAAARRLSRRGVLVRSARALEALGRVDTVCFDKTGTLTEGRLAVARLALPGQDIAFDSPLGRHLLRVAARASPRVDGEATRTLAHATDRAVVDAARTHAGPDRSWRLVDELPFETSRGYAASLGTDAGSSRLAVKGAPEVLLARCTSIRVPPGVVSPGVPSGAARGGPRRRAGGAGDEAASALVPMTPARRRAARALVHDLAADGLRVLAVAEADPSALAQLADALPGGQPPAPPGPAGPGPRTPAASGPARSGGRIPAAPRLGVATAGAVADLVCGLTLVGLLAIADTPRPTAAKAVQRLSQAGITITMITGDHPSTAAAIARQVGIPHPDRVLVGTEISKLAEAERTARIAASTVFARVSPEQKVHIVQTLQRAGRVVAMTGDGTNDAAAIRLADVGIGVSSRGSTSARSSADLVLTEADTSRIVDALVEGRALWASVRDAVSILVGGNAGEVAFTLLGAALTGRAPLNTRQLLLVNLLTDMFPALAVALAPAVPDGAGNGGDALAASGPVVSFLGAGLARNISIRGGATALGGIAAWQAGRLTGRRKRADTMGLAGVVLTQLGQTLLTNWRSPVVIVTSGMSAAALAGIVETPGVSQFFGCTPLGPVAWTVAAGSAAGATLAAGFAPRLIPDRLPPSNAQPAVSLPRGEDARPRRR